MEWTPVKTAGLEEWSFALGPIESRPWGDDRNIHFRKGEEIGFSALVSWKWGKADVTDERVTALVARLIGNQSAREQEISAASITEDQVTEYLIEKGYLEKGKSLSSLVKATAEAVEEGIIK